MTCPQPVTKEMPKEARVRIKNNGAKAYMVVWRDGVELLNREPEKDRREVLSIMHQKMQKTAGKAKDIQNMLSQHEPRLKAMLARKLREVGAPEELIKRHLGEIFGALIGAALKAGGKENLLSSIDQLLDGMNILKLSGKFNRQDSFKPEDEDQGDSDDNYVSNDN